MEKDEKRFIFVLVPPLPIAQDIERLRTQFSENYNCKSALKNPVHLTFFSPFAARPPEVKNGFSKLKEWTARQAPFPLDIKDFGFFDNRDKPVAFVNAIKNDALRDLHNGFTRLVKKVYNEVDYGIGPAPTFNPHFTLGYRDVPPALMPQIKKDYFNRRYSASFEVDRIYLWVHENGRWIRAGELPLSGEKKETQGSLF